MICNYCGQAAELVTGESIYPHRKDLYALKFWQCTPCNAYVGTHKGSPTAKPFGLLANAELRSAKSRTHRYFDHLWKVGKYTRTEAYKWLALKLDIPEDQCHIGMFDVDRCEEVIKICQES